jgi:hypothetical protein
MVICCGCAGIVARLVTLFEFLSQTTDCIVLGPCVFFMFLLLSTIWLVTISSLGHDGVLNVPGSNRSPEIAL